MSHRFPETELNIIKMYILFRVDASSHIGSGHLRRCLNLADELKLSGCDVQFVCRSNIGEFINIIYGRGHRVKIFDCNDFDYISSNNNDTGSDYVYKLNADIDREIGIISYLHDMSPDWIVVDSYKINILWERFFAHSKSKILVIDDLADRNHNCHILIDPTFARNKILYKNLVNTDCAVYTGVEFALLEKSFLSYYNKARNLDERIKIFIFMGSGISANNLYDVAHGILERFKEYEVLAVGSPEIKPLDPLVRQYSNRIEWVKNTKQMAYLMSKCSVSVGSPGTALWERACVGIPSALIAVDKNQINILEQLSNLKFATYLGYIEELDIQKIVDKLEQFFNDTHSLKENRRFITSSVDGLGCSRVTRMITS